VTVDDVGVNLPARHGPKRGELRIYLGAAPGVGKTFAMLGEAHRRLERGTDLVAAVVETHGRKKTAELFEDIEIVAPHYVDYRGGRFPELDVEAVLARHPQVVLVDELAHTNTPGSKNPKRWQDVDELLDAGITGAIVYLPTQIIGYQPGQITELGKALKPLVEG